MPDIDVIKTRECPNCKTKFSTFEEFSVEIVCEFCGKNLGNRCRIDSGNIIVIKPCECKGTKNGL